MNKSPFLYILGILFVILGLIPLVQNIFALSILNGNTILFVLAGIWTFAFAVFYFARQNYEDA